MPAFAHVDAFVAHARRVNPTFERVKSSSLHDLIALLRLPTCTPLLVKDELLKIPSAKAAKYADAMHLLIARMIGVDYGM